MNEKFFANHDNEFIINVQESAIGYSYPRIFIHSIDSGKFVNLDLSLPALFSMKEQDFLDWKADADEIGEEKFNSILENMGVNLSALSDILGVLNND